MSSFKSLTPMTFANVLTNYSISDSLAFQFKLTSLISKFYESDYIFEIIE
jgi:hypothetical protein